jgi:predicted  nucleic acid-binding Zn-ribbon protein
MGRQDLEDLLAVQELDLAVDQVRHRRDNLPERAEITAIEGRAAQLRSEVQSVTAQRDEVAKRQNEAESELAATEERAAAVSKRLYGGEVSASRELQAMAADVESLTQRASALEDRVLEILEEREPLDRRLEELLGEAGTLAARRKVAAAARAEAEATLDGELGDLMGRRAAQSETVPASLLNTYERLRGRLGGVGAARVVGNHCDGCHLTLSAVELDHIRHLPPGEVATCEQCSRILVPA